MTDELEDTPPDPPAPSRPKRAPALPSDLLGQRRALAARTFSGAPKVTSQRLREHAEKYGCDQIAQTGAESGMDEEQLTNLIASLDRINATFRRDPRKKSLHRSPDKTTPAHRARLLLGIEEPDPLTKGSQEETPRGGTIRDSATDGGADEQERGRSAGGTSGSRPRKARPAAGGDSRRAGPAERPRRTRRRRAA